MKHNIYEGILWAILFVWGAKLVVTDVSLVYTILGWFATLASTLGLHNILRETR